MQVLVLSLLLGADPEPMRMEWKIGDVTREALLYRPAQGGTSAAPVVFGFHGHGGTARNAAERFQLHRHWPEAIVVYMQGLPTPSKFDPDGKRPGWQHLPGDQQDRDLKFFDAVLASLRDKQRIDEDRIYATGHSNGGGFTYLLWATRSEVFAAFAPSAAGARNVRSLAPRPALHIAGEKDTIVPFANQKLTMEAVRKTNGCEEKGREWAKGCLLYPSEKGAPFVSFIHPGGHNYPDEAPPLIVRFFKEHARKPAAGKSP